MPHLSNRHTNAVGLRSHEGEGWFQDSVRKLSVMSSHALPQVIDYILDWNGTYRVTSASDSANVA